MKKSYIKPEMNIFKLAITQMLAASPDSVNNEVGNGTFLSREAKDIDDDY